VLQEIARRTHGTYVPARTEKLPLGKLLPSILASKLQDDSNETGEFLPRPKPRQDWFLAAALLFLALPLVGRPRRARSVRLALPMLAVVMAAGAAPDFLSWIRQGNEAYERGQDKEALEFFDKAEDLASDPGLVSFNKAAAFYRLGRFGEAALHYQRCLEDQAIPGARRNRAFFQMGNAYLRESMGSNRALLDKALDAYRSCLLAPETTGDLRKDARHNLEIARLLWMQTRPKDDEPEGPNPNPDKKPKDPSNKLDQKDKSQDANGQDAANGDSAKAGKDHGKGQSKKVQPGPLTVLPDSQELVPLSPGETEAHLGQITQRIMHERRHYRRHESNIPDNVKDW
jgi:tetratricopeptide (TPR) repeat protein